MARVPRRRLQRRACVGSACSDRCHSQPQRSRAAYMMSACRADPGEDFAQTVAREVVEETGVLTALDGVVSMRHAHGRRFGQGDLYVMGPLSLALLPASDRDPGLMTHSHRFGVGDCTCDGLMSLTSLAPVTEYHPWSLLTWQVRARAAEGDERGHHPRRERADGCGLDVTVAARGPNPHPAPLASVSLAAHHVAVGFAHCSSAIQSIVEREEDAGQPLDGKVSLGNWEMIDNALSGHLIEGVSIPSSKGVLTMMYRAPRGRSGMGGGGGGPERDA
jgi:8-oxo-dGTP pyrophosphatase MutT (NUDIX family)